MWNQKCFPDWKQKKPSIWFKSENTTKIENEDHFEGDLDISINNNIDINSCVKDFLKELENLKDKSGISNVEENDILNILTQNVSNEILNEDTNSMDELEEDDDILMNDFSPNNISHIKIKTEQPSCSFSVSPLPLQPNNIINDRICQMCWFVIFFYKILLVFAFKNFYLNYVDPFYP